MMAWGYQTQFDNLGLLDVVGTVKVINPQNRQAWAYLREASEQRGLVVVYRQHWEPGNQPLGSTSTERKAIAEERAEQVVRGIDALGKRPKHLLAEGYNETGLWNDADAYSEWTVYYAEALARHGIPHLCYNFPTANPPGYRNKLPGESIEEWAEAALKPYWAHYIPGLEATQKHGGALGLHEYLRDITPDYVPWHFGRHRYVVQVLPSHLKNIPIYLSEWGADWQLDGLNTGWRDYLADNGYAALILNANLYLRASRKIGCNIQGVHIFGLGMAEGWSTFDIKDSPAIKRAIESCNKEEEPMPVDQIKAWLVDMWRRQGAEPNTQTDAFFAYALKVAKEQGKAIIPMISKDGNYLNYSDPTRIVAYTIPPMWALKSGGPVQEGLPPNL